MTHPPLLSDDIRVPGAGQNTNEVAAHPLAPGKSEFSKSRTSGPLAPRSCPLATQPLRSSANMAWWSGNGRGEAVAGGAKSTDPHSVGRTVNYKSHFLFSFFPSGRRRAMFTEYVFVVGWSAVSRLVLVSFRVFESCYSI